MDTARRPDGRAGLPTDVHTIDGRSHNAGRQGGPHRHDVKFDPAGRFVFGAELGTDKVWSWHLDAASGKLIPNDLPFATIASGAGPPRLAFHPGARYVYVLGEIGSSTSVFACSSNRAHHSVAIFEVDETTAKPNVVGREPTQGLVPRNVNVDPSGTVLFAANQNGHTIVPFRSHQQTGRLAATGAITQMPTPVCIHFGAAAP